MKICRTLLLAACAVLIGGCAATVPHELTEARTANQRAAAGDAAQVAPVELHQADLALQLAEAAFEDKPKSAETRDLAYIALRKAEIAEATASVAIEKQRRTQAQADLLASQSEIAENAQQELAQAKSEQMATRQSDALAAAEQRTTAALAKLAIVTEDARGLVISLSGNVLFATNSSTLLPAARTRLDQLATALLEVPERNLLIEGHTDSQGSEGHNQTLSQARADCVRDVFVQRGYRSFLIKSSGMGETHPLADNATVEGRAKNRRVEIVIVRSTATSQH